MLACPSCGSWNLKHVEGEYATGVYAPDGTAEWMAYSGLKCLDCGAVEES